MKKILIFILIVVAAVFGICSCNIKSVKTELLTKQYTQCCLSGDFAKAHVILGRLRELAYNSEFGSWYMEGERNTYFGALEYIFKAELANICVSEQNKESARIKVLAFLGQIPIECEKTGGLHEKRRGEDEAFTGSVAAYNHICDYMLDLAIDLKDKELASAILRKFRKDVVCFYGDGVLKEDIIRYKGTLVDWQHVYFYFTNESIDKAKAKYNKAIQDGLI